MRVKPVVGSKVWFAPRSFGWGLTPISPEGWVVMTAMAVVSLVVKRRRDLPKWVPAAAMLPFLALMVLKGTTPGGPTARSAFDESRSGPPE